MRVLPGLILKTLSAAFLVALSFPVHALSLEQIRNVPDLTPSKFASFFRDFEFKFHREVQSPDVFLATRSGDCDDFSTLAAAVLREKGYTTRLITVRMPGVTHVVCYVEETESYLDYNNRSYFDRTVAAKPQIEAIAQSVAKSYKLDWISATEFSFDDGAKRLVQTVLPSKKEKSFAALFR